MNTEIFSQVNWLAVLVAALAYFFLGAIWYSKALIGTKWASLVGINMSDPAKSKGMTKMLVASLILILLTCIGLALLVIRLDLLVVMSAIKLGIMTGVCFAATAVAISFVYENRPAGIYYIDCGYHLVGHIIAAIILVLWNG